MRYPKPANYVILAVDTDGRPVPAAYRSTCQASDGSGGVFSQLHLPEGIRWFAKMQRSEGYVVTVEDLAAVPDEMMPVWLLMRLAELMPSDRRQEFKELGSLGLARAEQLRSGQLAVRDGDQLYLVVSPGGDEVLDLVFTRGRPLIFSRVNDEWMQSRGIGGCDYQSYELLPVSDQVIALYDERRASGQMLLLAELRELGLVAKSLE